MVLISKICRVFFRVCQSICFFLRVIKLKLLYPEISIDFKSKIHNNCSIVCVTGGKLIISNSTILSGTHIMADVNSKVVIQNSFIGRNCVITAKKSVSIKQGCLIAEMVVIRDQDHDSSNLSEENFISAPIIIEENVWIGSKATILKGVTIGKHSTIAASAVVTKNVPAYEVWGGIPAKFIKRVTIKLKKIKSFQST